MSDNKTPLPPDPSEQPYIEHGVVPPPPVPPPPPPPRPKKD